MRILAIDTSLKQGSVALLQGLQHHVEILVESVLPDDQRTAQSLLPTLATLCRETQWQPQDLQLIVVTTGPGSFTGLRIGVTTAKTLAYALGVPLVGVHTLATLAENGGTPATCRWAILDAQRQQLFAARFESTPGLSPTTHPDTQILDVADWLQRLQPGDEVVGPPLEQLASQLPPQVVCLDRNLWYPRASVAGRLGYLLATRGQTDDAIQLVPRYYRRSAAEERAR